jgi:hypothetical protein
MIMPPEEATTQPDNTLIRAGEMGYSVSAVVAHIGAVAWWRVGAA